MPKRPQTMQNSRNSKGRGSLNRNLKRDQRRNKVYKTIAHWSLVIGVGVASIVQVGAAGNALSDLLGNDVEPPSITVPRRAPVIKESDPGVVERIRRVIEDRGFERGEDLLRIITECENRILDPFAYNVNLHTQESGGVFWSIDRGIAMFNDYHRSDVSNECAFNVECSINKMIDTYYDWGSFDAWVCADILNIN